MTPQALRDEPSVRVGLESTTRHHTYPWTPAWQRSEQKSDAGSVRTWKGVTHLKEESAGSERTKCSRKEPKRKPAAGPDAANDDGEAPTEVLRDISCRRSADLERNRRVSESPLLSKGATTLTIAPQFQIGRAHV